MAFVHRTFTQTAPVVSVSGVKVPLRAFVVKYLVLCFAGALLRKPEHKKAVFNTAFYFHRYIRLETRSFGF